MAVRLVERRVLGAGSARLLLGLFTATAIAALVAAGSSVVAVVVVALILQHGFRVGADPLLTMIANDHDESEARATVLSFISHIMTLLPGDLVYTGTPEGVPTLAAGSVIRVECEGFALGRLTNPITG